MTPKIIVSEPGYGNTKVGMESGIHVMQTAVAMPVNVGLAATGMRVAEEVTRVLFENFEFVTGEGAWRWGQTYASSDYVTLMSPERLALMYACIAKLHKPGDLGDVVLTVALPVPLLQDMGQMELLRDSARRLKRGHCFKIANREWRFNVVSIKLMAQPSGAYFDWTYSDDLSVRKGAQKADVAIIDLGMKTLDIIVFEGGQVRPGFLGGDTVGVHRLLHLLNKNGYELSELDAMLRNGRIKPSDAEIEIWLSEVLNVVQRTLPSLKRFNAVIPTGGGAALLGQRLTTVLAAKGAAVYWPTDPITSNVRGLLKYALKMSKN